MSDKPRILIQLDSDPYPSVFDSVVAVDCGVAHLFQYGGVTAEHVEGLVHGAMFTRGATDLSCTAIFVGGSDVALGEAIMKRVTETFFGPVRVSVMLDASGANTTAAAAVVAARRHLDLRNAKALVLGATGPVGQRVVRLLDGAGAKVRAASRRMDRARQLVETLSKGGHAQQTEAVAVPSLEQLHEAIAGVELVIAAGAAGVELVPSDVRESCSTLKVAIDLNAVPPLGIGGIDMTNKATDVSGVVTYGALGVGGTKMRIHKACIARLFESNDAVLDVDAIYSLAMRTV